MLPGGAGGHTALSPRQGRDMGQEGGVDIHVGHVAVAQGAGSTWGPGLPGPQVVDVAAPQGAGSGSQLGVAGRPPPSHP